MGDTGNNEDDEELYQLVKCIVQMIRSIINLSSVDEVSSDRTRQPSIQLQAWSSTDSSLADGSAYLNKPRPTLSRVHEDIKINTRPTKGKGAEEWSDLLRALNPEVLVNELIMVICAYLLIKLLFSRTSKVLISAVITVIIAYLLLKLFSSS